MIPYPSTSISPHTPTGYIKWQVNKSGVPVSAMIPTVICPETLEYKGENLDQNQLKYNALARRAGTKEIIETQINNALTQGVDKEEATRRAHSYAEAQVCIIHAGFKPREEEEEEESEAE